MKRNITKILLNYDTKEKEILPALKEISAAFGWISQDNANKVSEYFKVPLSKVYEIATFYDLINIHKQPQWVIKVCSGGNCTTSGSFRIVKEIESFFHIKEGDKFNPKVKLEFMSCLGRCEEGPVVEVNGKVFTKVTASNLHEILSDLI